MNRPTNREIDKRLKEAKEALENRQVAFANHNKVVGELMDLKIEKTDEVWDLISKIINEIRIKDYNGAYPPLKSYEPNIENHELWAFSWHSSNLDRQMYLKFSVKNGYFYYVSLHECKSFKE